MQDKNHCTSLMYCQVIIIYHVSNKLYRMVSCNTNLFVVQRMQEYHHRVLKYGANRHINFENCQYNYHLRPPLNQLFCNQRTCLWHWKPDLPALLRLERRGKGAGKYLLQILRPVSAGVGPTSRKKPKR